MPLEFQVKGLLTGARFDDPRLPSSVTNLEVDFKADNHGLVVNHLQAQVGEALLTAKGNIDGFAQAPLSTSMRTPKACCSAVAGSQFCRRYYSSRGEFMPAGIVDADLGLVFDGRSYHPDLNVKFQNLSVTYWRFPYPLHQVTGWMTLKEKHLETEVVGYGGLQPVHVKGTFDNPGEHFTGEIEIKGENQRFDKNLFDALAVFCQKSNHPETCAALQSLNPDGSFDFAMHGRRDVPDAPMTPSLTVTLNRASVRYVKFAYPISNIRGTLVQEGTHWTFRDLEGTNGPGRIYCNGTLDPVADGSELKLHFSAVKVPLQDDLRDALNPEAQRVWNNLRPQGEINVEAVDLRFLSATKTHELSFRVRPVDASMSIEPVAFPYRLERLQGALNYKDGHFDLEEIKAVHGRTPFRTGGFCDFDREGNWHLQLNQLAIDQVQADGDLVPALGGR